MLDPEDFARRFLVNDPPTSASLGPVVRCLFTRLVCAVIVRLIADELSSTVEQGSILCHVLLAWAFSYGIDESGKEAPQPTTNEDRIKRRQKCNEIVNECLTEIDRFGYVYASRQRAPQPGALTLTRPRS